MESVQPSQAHDLIQLLICCTFGFAALVVVLAACFGPKTFLKALQLITPQLSVMVDKLVRLMKTQ